MLYIIQIFGVIFGVGMLYLTYIYFRRREFNRGDTVFWGGLWAGFIFLLASSSSVNKLLETLHIHRAMDLFMMSGFIIMTMVIFYLYASVRRLSKKMELLVRKVALRK